MPLESARRGDRYEGVSVRESGDLRWLTRSMVAPCSGHHGVPPLPPRFGRATAWPLVSEAVTGALVSQGTRRSSGGSVRERGEPTRRPTNHDAYQQARHGPP